VGFDASKLTSGVISTGFQRRSQILSKKMLLLKLIDIDGGGGHTLVGVPILGIPVAFRE